MHWESRAMKFAVYACLASLACTFFNISFLAVRRAVVTNEIKYANIHLETPNHYIGLENAVHDPDAPPPASISNFPFLTAQVNKSEPRAVYYENNRHFTNFGTAYPTDRKFRVAAGVSTIIQFRVQDFGMEKCTLTLSTGMAPPAPGHGHTRSMPEHERGHPTGRIELWKLDQDRRLDPRFVSWNTRPQRSALITSWDLVHSESLRTEEFACESRAILTFELACAGQGSAPCDLDFTQPREQPESGAYFHSSSPSSASLRDIVSLALNSAVFFVIHIFARVLHLIGDPKCPPRTP